MEFLQVGAIATPTVPKRLRIYISGPMSGLPDQNRGAFLRAAEVLRQLGCDPVDPGELPEPAAGDEHHHFLERDLMVMMRCDGGCVLEGWEDSSGCLREIYTASLRGLPCFLDIQAEEAIADLRWRRGPTIGAPIPVRAPIFLRLRAERVYWEDATIQAPF